MPEIVWKYYVGRGPEAEDVIARSKKAWNDVMAARHALMEEFGADGILPGDKHRYTVAGLLFYEKPSFEYMKYVQSAVTTKDGRTFWEARPAMRMPEGKAFAERLAGPELTFSRSHELINELEMGCMADFVASANQTNGSLVWSSAEEVNNIILVRMPADASKQHILGTPPRIPKYMKLIKKDVFDRLLAGEDPQSVLDKVNSKI